MSGLVWELISSLKISLCALIWCSFVQLFFVFVLNIFEKCDILDLYDVPWRDFFCLPFHFRFVYACRSWTCIFVITLSTEVIVNILWLGESCIYITNPQIDQAKLKISSGFLLSSSRAIERYATTLWNLEILFLRLNVRNIPNKLPDNQCVL